MISWIKIETTLPQKPEVARLALRLKVSQFEALGLCVAFWIWLDGVTTDGVLRGADDATIDTTFHREGFAEALRSVGWLAINEHGVPVVPAFEKHNGATSKRRVQTARRVVAHRMRNGGNSHGK